MSTDDIIKRSDNLKKSDIRAVICQNKFLSRATAIVVIRPSSKWETNQFNLNSPKRYEATEIIAYCYYAVHKAIQKRAKNCIMRKKFMNSALWRTRILSLSAEIYLAHMYDLCQVPSIFMSHDQVRDCMKKEIGAESMHPGEYGPIVSTGRRIPLGLECA